LADLGRSTWPQDGKPPPDTALYFALPNPRRIYSDPEIVPDTEQRATPAAREQENDHSAAMDVARRLLDRAATLLEWKAVPRIALVSIAGHAAVTEAIAAAMRDLAAPSGPRTAIVGGIDTLLDYETLMWLNQNRRLKHTDNPIGVEPGEAAAFLVLERPVGRQPPERTLAYLAAAHVEVAGNNASPGTAVMSAVSKTIGSAGENDAPAWLLADHDGTPECAVEIGSLTMRMKARWNRSRPTFLFPASSFGDVGAATGAVASCLAMAAWNRGWASSSVAHIVSGSGSTGPAAAHVLLAPDEKR
jgi:3-oxoacyl-[acyl-carrier-protein] synthase-1